MRVQIHSQVEPPFVHELGFGVAPGFQTFVATQEQRVSALTSTSTQLIAFLSFLLLVLFFTSNPHVQLITQR